MKAIWNRIILCFILSAAMIVACVVGVFTIGTKQSLLLPLAIAVYMAASGANWLIIIRKNKVLEIQGELAGKQKIKKMFSSVEECRFRCVDDDGNLFDAYVSNNPKVVDTFNRPLIEGGTYTLVYVPNSKDGSVRVGGPHSTIDVNASYDSPVAIIRSDRMVAGIYEEDRGTKSVDSNVVPFPKNKERDTR